VIEVKDKIGVVHGRFQLLHNEHLNYILAGKAQCKHLIVGICNPDSMMTKYSEIDPHRSQKNSNPFTYYERYQMICAALLENNISQMDFDIVPFPINYPELLCNYVPLDAIHYLTIYDSWGLNKKKILEDCGYHVEVLWQRDLSEKKISGTDIRQLICEGKEWRQFVPATVYNYVIEHHLDFKVK